MKRRSLFQVLRAFLVGLLLPFQWARDWFYPKVTRWQHCPAPLSSGQWKQFEIPGEDDRPESIMWRAAWISRSPKTQRLDVSDYEKYRAAMGDAEVALPDLEPYRALSTAPPLECDLDVEEPLEEAAQ